jgi:hypothetical protein
MRPRYTWTRYGGWRLLTAPLMLLSGLAACSDKGRPTESLKGPIARLISPNGAEGAAVIEFAAVVDSVVLQGGIAYLHAASGRTRAALVLEHPGAVRFSLPHGTPGAVPAATVIEVADGSNQLRSTVAGYRVAYDR